MRERRTTADLIAELEDLVRYENENTALDFKRSTYRTPQHEELLKDVMAMANAHIAGDRHIVLGVEYRVDGTRDILGIGDAPVIDAASYQQLIRDNIEPDLSLEYLSLELDGKRLTAFCVSGCDGRPYSMRKDFSATLKKGDAWIRKGTTQDRMLRADYERIFAARAATSGFAGSVRFAFTARGQPTELALALTDGENLPSAEYVASIQAILDNRARTQSAHFGYLVTQSITLGDVFGNARLENLPDKDLRERIASAAEDFSADDTYELLEVRAAKVNIEVFNEGDEYLEDAWIELIIPETAGLLVVPKIVPPPPPSFPGASSLGFLTPPGYPDVANDDAATLIRARVGDVRHGVWTTVFQEPVRIVTNCDADGAEIVLGCTLRSRNLRTPIMGELHLRVGSASSPA